MILISIIFSFLPFVSIEAVHLSSCATWNPTGMTIFGGHAQGNASNQLNLPQGMFLHSLTNTLYVVDTGNRRIQMFMLDQPSTVGITALANIDSVYAVYVDDDGVTMYVALRFENRVEKWIKGASSGERVGDQCKQCRDVWVDREKNVYMTESGTHSILKWSPYINQSRPVAGQRDESSQTNDRLYFPTHIYMNPHTNTLYVADTMNNRIQKWNNQSNNGITVAGSKDGISSSDASSLASPLFVWVDDISDVIYIADSDNNRIQRWLPNESTGTTIVGGTGSGNESNQLKVPNSLVFDHLGNLYVCDSKNHRIQMYALMNNHTCPINHSHSLLIKSTTISINIFMLLSWVIATRSRSI